LEAPPHHYGVARIRRQSQGAGRADAV